ncbi:hypothetical protein KLMIMM195B_19100 [Klebsiella michiganensis]
MALNGGRCHAVKVCRRVAVNESLMNRMTHDVTEVLPRAGRDFQQTFFLNAFQQVNEMTGFKFRDGQMSDNRKNMIVHAGKQTVSGILRPFFIAFMPRQRHCLKDLFR